MNKHFLMSIIGCLLLVVGVALILRWWPDLASFFRGVIGIILTLAGLLVLYSLKK